MAAKLAPFAYRALVRSARPIPCRLQCRAFSSSKRAASASLAVHRDTPDNNQSIPFEFNDMNKKLIDEILKRYPPQYKKAAVMPLLDLGQRQHGFTSISVMNEVARILEMPPMRVYEVATFYTMYNRTPVGRYHVQACTTTPCQLGGVGSDQVVKAIEDHLGLHSGQSSADGLFTFTEVECLGACVNAPMVQINDDYYEDLTYDSTIQLLKALQATAEATGHDGKDRGHSGADPETDSGRKYIAKGLNVKVPAPGPQSGRKTCENASGQTTLLSPMWGKDALRTDGEL